MTSNTWHYENFEYTGSAIGFRIVKKLDEVQSPFQKIEIYETTDFGNLMLIDGAMMVSTRENFFYHEMMSHAAIYTHAKPKNIVIIGGGDCGTLRECLKHADVDMNFPIVLGLIQTPTVAYLLQEYLVTGKITYPNPITFNNFI